MKLEEFIEAGLKVEKVFNCTHTRRIMKEEETYKKVLDYIKNVSGDWDKVKEYAHSFKCYLGGILSSGDEITDVVLRFDDPDTEEALLVTDDDFGYFIDYDKNTHEVNKISLRTCPFDCIGYYSSHSIYEKSTLTDETTVNQIFDRVYNFYISDLKNVRSHYNNELRKLKAEYKETLKNRKNGLKFITKSINKGE